MAMVDKLGSAGCSLWISSFGDSPPTFPPQLSNLITEFLQGPAVDPAVQLSFQDFLSRRAAL